MPWIPSYQELGTHPKTLKMSRLMGISEVQVVGHLQFLWWWAMDYADDGDLSRFDSLDIAIACHWEGDPDLLRDVLIRVGFLDSHEEPDHPEEESLTIHDWDQYGGKFLNRKDRNAARMREARAAQNEGGSGGSAAHVQRTFNAHDEHVEKSVQLEESRGEERRVEESREQESRGENQQQDTRGLDIFPPPTAKGGKKNYPPDFEMFWQEYPKGRGSKVNAFSVWEKLRPDVAMVEAIMAGLAVAKVSTQWQQGGQYVPYAERFLKRRVWENPPLVDKPPPRGLVAQSRAESMERLIEISQGGGVYEHPGNSEIIDIDAGPVADAKPYDPGRFRRGMGQGTGAI